MKKVVFLPVVILVLMLFSSRPIFFTHYVSHFCWPGYLMRFLYYYIHPVMGLVNDFISLLNSIKQLKVTLISVLVHSSSFMGIILYGRM